jgi:hypothetical protein
VVVFPSLNVVTQVFTFEASMVQLGPLVTVVVGAWVVVVHTPAPLVTAHQLVPWHVTSPQAQVPDNSEPSVDAHVEAGVGPLVWLPDAS